MTTTEATKKPATPNLDAELDGAGDVIAKALESGERTTGGFEGPSWVPMLAEKHNPDLKPEALAKKIEKAGPGSTVRDTIAGALHAAFAWGRRAYFLDVTTKAGVVRVKLPENKLLYKGLNLWPLGAKVAIRYDGLGKAKDGRKPPHLWTVAGMDPKAKALSTPRTDSLVAESMDERKARQDAEKRRQALAAVKAQNVAAGIDAELAAANAGAGDESATNAADADGDADDMPF